MQQKKTSSACLRLHCRAISLLLVVRHSNGFFWNLNGTAIGNSWGVKECLSIDFTEFMVESVLKTSRLWRRD
jgi:hypothetical protein